MKMYQCKNPFCRVVEPAGIEQRYCGWCGAGLEELSESQLESAEVPKKTVCERGE